MDSPQWNACIEYFRFQFPNCPQCQNGHDTLEILMTHLTESHYQQEASNTFGNCPKCAVCAKVLDLTGDDGDQHHVVSHMARHLPIFIPGQAKHFLMVAEEAYNEYKEEEEEKTLSSFVSSTESEPMLNETCSESFLDESKTTEGDSKLDMTNKSTGLYWQECEDFVKKEFPRCKTCQAGFNYFTLLRSHVICVHYGDIAMRQFGIGKNCDLCPEFEITELTPSSKLKHLIKSHMATKHFSTVLPEIAKPAFRKALELQGKVSSSQMVSKSDLANFVSQNNGSNFKSFRNTLWQSCADLLRTKHPMCKTCQTGFGTPSKIMRHYGPVHCGEKALKLFGSKRNCAECNDFKLPASSNSASELRMIQETIKKHMTSEHFQLIIPDEAKNCFAAAIAQPKRNICIVSKTSWQNVINFFKEKNPHCSTCQNDFKTPSEFLNHLAGVHYKEEVFRKFGSGNVCNMCKQYKIPAKGRKVLHFRVNSFIQRHMRAHLTQLMSGKAKLLLENAIGSTPVVADIASPFKTPSMKTETHTLPEIANTKMEVEQVTSHKEIVSKKLPSQAKENVTDSGVALHDCLQYFKQMNSNCKLCQRGHRSMIRLKRHLTRAHYGRSAIELFGRGPACPICNDLVLSNEPCNKITIKEKKTIKDHMSAHLEEFIVGKAKNVLQKASEALPKHLPTSPGKKNAQTKKPDGRRTKLAWLDCERYFKEKYPSCKVCRAGFSGLSAVRIHVSYSHCEERPIELFGGGRNCSICMDYPVPQKTPSSRSHHIKQHMGKHLELFIQDEQARELLLKAKYTPRACKGRKVKKATGKKISQDEARSSMQPSVVLRRLSDAEVEKRRTADQEIV